MLLSRPGWRVKQNRKSYRFHPCQSQRLLVKEYPLNAHCFPSRHLSGAAGFCYRQNGDSLVTPTSPRFVHDKSRLFLRDVLDGSCSADVNNVRQLPDRLVHLLIVRRCTSASQSSALFHCTWCWPWGPVHSLLLLIRSEALHPKGLWLQSNDQRRLLRAGYGAALTKPNLTQTQLCRLF